MILTNRYHCLLCFILLFDLFLLSFEAIVKTGSITKIPQIPNDFSYSIFSSKYKIQFILLCDKTSKKACNEKQLLLNHIQKQYDSSSVGAAVIETKNVKELPREKLIYEGFPSIHYISLLPPFEKEVLTFNINPDTLNRFIKSKLNPFKKQVPNEESVIKSLNTNSASRALVLVGNGTVSDEILFHAAKKAEIRLIYQIKSIENSQNITEGKEGIALYYKNKTKDEYNHKIIEFDKDIGKRIFTNEVLFSFKQGINRNLNQITPYELELAFEKNIPSIIYIYNTLSDIDYIKDKINSFIQKHEHKISFSQVSINDELLKMLGIKKFFNIEDTMLPGFICLIPSFTNSIYDDVIKYYIPFNQGKNITQRLDDVVSNSNSTGKILFTDNKENVNAIAQHIKNREEFVLLICSNKLLKYRRISQRIKRSLAQIRKQVLFEEIDPLTNEIDFMTYEYIPTIAYIKPSKTSTDIMINKLEYDLTTEGIFNFIKAHSTAIIDPSIHIPSSIINTDKENPLYPVHKSRYEKRFLLKGSNSLQVGLRRMWWSLKHLGRIVKGKYDQKYITDYLGYSDEDYDKKDYANNKKKQQKIQPKTEL